MDELMRERVWLAKCYEKAAESPDPSTQIGAAIIIGNQLQLETLSFNGPTAGWQMTDEEWENKTIKYQVVEHAERRAIYKAARQGLWTEGGTLISTWAACADCARAVVEAGIKRLIRHVPPSDDAVNRWLQSVELGDQIMVANGIEILNIEGRIPDAPGILRGGEAFYPDAIGVVPV